MIFLYIRNNRYLKIILFSVSAYLFLIFFLSCSIIDFSPEENIETNPSKENQIIYENEEIYVSFKFEPEKTSAESIFRINDYNGKINGSIEWNGNTMIFSPEKDLIAGRRYILDYSGTFSKKQGEELSSEIIIPFFYKTSSCMGPYIGSALPAGGSLITGDRPITFYFSKQMNNASVKKGLKVSPDTDYTLSWNNTGTELTVAPVENWTNLAVYSFQFSEDVCCIDNIPLETEYCFSFYCDNSHFRPEVISKHTVLNNITLLWPRVSEELSRIKYREGIEIEFSCAMNKDSAENSFSIEPYTAGRVFWKNSCSMVFIPDSGWLWNKSYKIRILKTAESEDGITSGEDYSISFSPDIPELILTSISAKTSDGFPVSFYEENSPLHIDTGTAPPYTYSFSFSFSEPFLTDCEKEKVQENINITSVFPPDALSPFPFLYSWSGNSNLTVEYTGFTPCNNEDNIFYSYLLSLEGGENGIRNSCGSFFENDIRQLLRTK